MEIKKLTLADLESEIVNTKFVYDGTLTICTLTLRSGFKVVDQSACMNPKDYSKKIGESVSKERAINQLWELLGFHLMQKQYEQENK